MRGLRPAERDGPPKDIGQDGAVAQLGERLLCKQEVIGSIPFGSTSFLTSRERKKIENGYRRFAPSNLFFGCLTLWIGCKARLDASSRAHAGVCWCVAMELGSDSARVNEVAKLCRAVVHGMEGKESSEGSSAGLKRELRIGLLKGC